MSKDVRPIIIVRRKKVVHGHHGGAWKIAFADFMTALMALFLVMWILSASSQEQKAAVAEYFSTPLLVAMAGGNKAAASDSAIPGGGPDPMKKEGERAMVSVLPRPSSNAQQRRSFMDLQKRIEEAIEADSILRELRSQLRFDMTEEGLRIQVLDTDQRPMFDVSSTKVVPYMRTLLRTIAPLLNELPNELSISGHTDGLQYADGYGRYSNWELSSGRANASRQELVAGGLDAQKLLRVSGFADRVTMPETAHNDAINRRIELLVLFPEVAKAVRSPVKLEGNTGVPIKSAARILKAQNAAEENPFEEKEVGVDVASLPDILEPDLSVEDTLDLFNID